MNRATKFFILLLFAVPGALLRADASPEWAVYYNLPQQSSSGTVYPGQFVIRDALIARIDRLQSGHTATLSTFTFSANEGAGAIINALTGALDRGAEVRFIADDAAAVDVQYGGTNTLRKLSARTVNPLTLVVDDDAGGIMHHKFCLFDYGGTDQWVFTASWNFTLAASSSQWNIALELRSPVLYRAYMDEAAELLAGRFHDHTDKSHAHDKTPFELDGSQGTHFVRFAPYPDALLNGNNAETDILDLIAQSENEIVFALNKLNRFSIRNALTAAANRGIRITGVIPASDTAPGGVSAEIYGYLTDPSNYTTTNTVRFLTAHATADFSTADRGEPDLVHAKYMVIDPGRTNAVVIHGSANWTAGGLASTSYNDENTLVLRHPEIAEKFHEHFRRMTGSGPFTAGNAVLVRWDFTDGDVTADGGALMNAGRTVRREPAPSATNFVSGALSVSGWNSGAGTKYWETDFSTLRHTGISVSSKQTSTTTGPAGFKLQYKIDAHAAYADVPDGSITVGTGWGGQLYRLRLPAECDNRDQVFLRWIMTADTAVNGNTVAASGAGRIDDILITGNAYGQPPALDPVGHREVFEGQQLSFSVSASDPIDGDPVSLSASDLPSGASFVNSVFLWDPAVPTGEYAVTFHAADKDGISSETVLITVSQRPLLLISEIADPAGTGGDACRFVELYNAGPHAIDLEAGKWHLCRQVNGGSTWNSIPLTGTVAVAKSWVLAKSRDDFFRAYGFYPDQENTRTDGNGDDAYFLYRGGDHKTGGLLIDAYGEPDTNGTDSMWEYTDGRAVRLDTIRQPNSTWSPHEWFIFQNSIPDDMTPGRHGAVPVFNDLKDPFVFLGDDLSLTVSAANAVSPDVITLSADTLPDGAVFAPVTGLNEVSGMLHWEKPPEGIYDIVFSAAGANGTNTLSVLITVSNRSRIDGKVHGWSGDTLFKLENGQFWQQSAASSKTISPPLHRPFVTITNVAGQSRMLVANVTGFVAVTPQPVIESAVTNTFSGLYHQNIYQLDDRTSWKQISFENSSGTASPVTAWRWIKEGRQMLRLIDRDDNVIGTCIVEPADPPENAPILSEIDGWFRGWNSKRVFALKNGQFWQQISFDTSSTALYRPAVTITNWLQTGIRRMHVAGADGCIQVQQLANVTRTTVAGNFYGLRYGTVYRLDDGSDWLQISFETIRTNVPAPSALLWTEENRTRLLLRDALGMTIGTCTVTDPDGDDDGDGLSNREELIAASDPQDPESRFLASALCPPETGPVITWESAENRLYDIEWAPSLTEPFQTLEASIAWPQSSWTDTVHTAAAMNFYRIIVRLAEETE